MRPVRVRSGGLIPARSVWKRMSFHGLLQLGVRQHSLIYKLLPLDREFCRSV
jgi:hypothetical protein